MPLKVKRRTKEDTQTPDVEINAVGLYDIYKIVFSEYHKVNPAAKSVKNLSLLKKLLGEQGQGIATKLVVDTVKNWEKFRNSVKPPIVGYPSIPIIWGFRNTFLAVMNNQVSQRKNSVEYTDDRDNKKADTKKLFLGE